MTQDRKFLGMLGSETVNILIKKCDGVVRMSNPNKKSNKKEIIMT